jgi:hypothetical protein
MAGGGMGTNRNGGNAGRPGNGGAHGKQTRLQCDRIGRCQRCSGARVVPQIHN